MATDYYELIPKLETLKYLCGEHRISLDPSPGHRMLLKGQMFYVISTKNNAVALIDEIPSIPFDPNRIVYVQDWEEEPNCIFIPNIEDLLEIIRDSTTLFPSMIPGVKKTREVWQVRHTEGTTIVTGSLLEGLLDLVIQKLEEKD